MALKLTEEQFRERYGQEGVSMFKKPTPVNNAKKEGFLTRAGKALRERMGELGKTFSETKEGRISPVETGFRTAGDVAAIPGDLIGAALAPKIEEIANKEWAKPFFEALGKGMDYYEKVKNKNETNRRIGEMLESFVNIADLAAGLKGGQALVKGGKVGAKIIEESGEMLAERIKNLKSQIPEKYIKTSVDAISDITEEAGEATKKASILENFTDNPAISGTVDDIKEMIGLPTDTPSVDYTFRAIKPRLTKDKNLRRIKDQMALANQTIAENGFMPKSVDEYASAIYDTKKNVWAEIQGKYDKLGKDIPTIDLTPIAVEILDKASDPALMRINKKAAQQLTDLAENLVKYGDNVDLLEAERMKQLLNAELEGAFGDIDMSQQLKEAKKSITRKIGEQLNEKLSDFPDEFKQLKTKYGALSAIEEDALKRAIVFGRQNPEGLVDMLTKTEAAVELVTGSVQGKMRALSRLTAGRLIKKANDANELVKKAFQKIYDEMIKY